MGETLTRTTIGVLQRGERQPGTLRARRRAAGRSRGAGTRRRRGRLLEREDLGDWERLRFTFRRSWPATSRRKGSIAVDGVSLTVTAVSEAGASAHLFEVGLIPTTLADTGLGAKPPGDAREPGSGRAGEVRRAVAGFTPGSSPLHAAPRRAADRGLPTPSKPPWPRSNHRDGRRPSGLVVDNEDRENEGDIIFAADAATPALMGWTIRHTSGVDLRTARQRPAPTNWRCRRWWRSTRTAKGTAYTVSCDAAAGVSTGISSADRARTATVLAAPDSTAADLTRPGHVFPLRAVDGGVLVAPGHTEAAVDLCRLGGRAPVGVIAELVHDEGDMMRLDGLRGFAINTVSPISIADLVVYLEAGNPWQLLAAMAPASALHLD